tara:strand:- start:784 stop:1737 length:954 start_codon:yes stop_codon:yes gene_type:complete
MEELEKIKITSTNIRSILTRSTNSLSRIKMKRLKLKERSRLFALRNRKKEKLEKNSAFKRSINKIKGVTPPIIKNFGDGIISFAGLLLLGFIVNNIEGISEKIKEGVNKIKETFKPITAVIEQIYNSATGFVKMFDDESKTDDFKKVEENFKEAQPIIDEVDKDLKTIGEKIGNFTGANLGKINDSGTLSDGRTYDIINLYDKDKGIVPFYRIKDEKGNIEISATDKLINDMIEKHNKDNPSKKIIIPKNESESRFYKEKKNQWWDVLNIIPNGYVFDNEKFNNIEGLPNTVPEYKNPANVNSEVKVLRQVVITDKE